MQKQLNKAICVAVFMLLLTNTSFATVQDEINIKNDIAVEQVTHTQNVQVNDLDIEPINTQEVKKTVVPDVKKEGKKVFQNFLKAMALAILSGGIIYLILLFVNKYYGSAFVSQEDDEYFEALDLQTPDNRPDALKSFLNRTK
ncbi:hypothetical protein IJ425_08675 [bacterium]|nr:hypothetical protein [bacterium]